MNSIIWDKWNDPMLPPVKKGQNVNFEPAEDDDDVDFRDAKASFMDDEDYSERQAEGGSSNFSHIGPCVVGPHGIIPVFESNLPSTLFNFWMGHTNFDLTEAALSTIEAVPGVETIDVFSRYRFRMAVGKAFQQDAVKSSIVAALNPKPPAEQESVSGIKLKKSLSKSFPFWAVAYLPANDLQGLGGSTKDEVLNKLKRYVGVAKLVVTSWEQV